MPISFALHPNNLTADPDDYTAIVQFTSSVDLDGLVERMVNSGSTVTKADILAVLEDYHATIIHLVLEGYKVTTPTANYGASIQGHFAGWQDSYSPDRHRLRATVSTGANLRRAMARRGRTQKLETVKPCPKLLEFFDYSSDSPDHLLTPGGMARLTGHRLKFDPTDLVQGIFFTAGDGQVSRVEVVAQNRPGELLFQIPAGLSPGEYAVEVRAAFGREVRSGQLEARLSVV